MKHARLTTDTHHLLRMLAAVEDRTHQDVLRDAVLSYALRHHPWAYRALAAETRQTGESPDTGQ